MFAGLHLVLVGVLAYFLQPRVALLEEFRGLARYGLAFGLALFLVNWGNFLLYVLCGWGPLYLTLSWALVLGPICVLAQKTPAPAIARGGAIARVTSHLGDFRNWNGALLFLGAFVLVRFCLGPTPDREGAVWASVNFVDTAIHLSIANAFLGAARFPPVDLDMAPFPLKYHFLADFYLAHLERIGWSALKAIAPMNFLSAAVMVGALWATFARWLRLSSRWVLLAALIFLFLNPALPNLLHYALLAPPYFRADSFFTGVLMFPYFNFEATISSLFEPQRGLLFSFPVVLLVMNGIFGGDASATQEGATRAAARTLEAFVLVCLLPLAHVVSAAVLGAALLPSLWRHRRALAARWLRWLPAVLLGAAQVLYLFCYGPPLNPNYEAWNAAASLPLDEFARLPAFLRPVAFWFFVNGDFLFWGLLFAAGGLWRSRRATAGAPGGLADFLRRWKWYWIVCAGAFLLINVYRYTADWGDSNKFILFLNLGLSLVIVLGIAQWRTGRLRLLAHALWVFFFVLCVAPFGYQLFLRATRPPYDQVVLFNKYERVAAEWLRRFSAPTDLVLTGTSQIIHFVTPLAGRPVPAGLYGRDNPYRQDERAGEIRRVYEQADFAALRQLNPRFICISRNERRLYRLSAKWQDLIRTRKALLFQVGDADEFDSVFIFDSDQLEQGQTLASTAGK
ncbi:MAG TPA: hypothetical protein VHD62_11395 [Opitutaceae bacterium]|nr:hypothetical protein [Opitutaceae bacterium]